MNLKSNRGMRAGAGVSREGFVVRYAAAVHMPMASARLFMLVS